MLTAEETFGFGKKLASLLKSGDTVCLTGDLGAGKTLTTQGIAIGLRVNETVTSPTFGLMNVYQGRMPIYHFDLYRLESVFELEDIGFYEYTDPSSEGIAIVEWADKFPDSLPAEHLWIELRLGENFSERLLLIEPRGSHYEKICEELK
jgi:tRNA threonylcarbamoyladenosine biosynthesis protein TsaE